MGVLSDIRDHVADTLEAHADFVGITVVREDKGNIAAAIAAELSKVKLSVIVMTPSAPRGLQDTRSAYFDEIRVAVMVGETQINNGSRASNVAELVAAIVTGTRLDGTFETLVFQGITLVSIPAGSPLALLYRVDFTTRGGVQLQTPTPTVATPVIDAANPAAVTITCATAGAAIYWTTDGTRPGPQNGTLYTGAFAADSGDTVKARAGRWGAHASAIASAVVP